MAKRVKPAKKGAPTVEKKKRPMVVLPEDLHRSLKMYAAAHGTNVKAMVTEAAADYLKQKGGTKN